MKYWKELLIIGLVVAVVLLLVIHPKPPADNSFQQRIESVVKQNDSLKQSLKHYNDSVAVVIKQKDDIQVGLEQKLKSITAKYIAIRNTSPVHDTVVKDSIVYNGNECLEKLPIVEQQRDNCLSEVQTLKNQVSMVMNANDQLQKQFDIAIIITNDQTKEIKKLDRRRKWNKIWAVTTTALSAGLITTILIIK